MLRKQQTGFVTAGEARRAQLLDMMWWTPVECGEYLAKSTDMLKKWRHEKKGPPWHYSGRSILYRPVEVERWRVGKEHGIERVHTVGRPLPGRRG